MRVQFKTEGGIAHFPGLSQPIVLDSTTLAAEDAQELQRLVTAAGFFEQPQSGGAPPRGAADYRRYTITVDDGQRQHTVHLIDPVADQALAQLLHFLQDKARTLRRPDR
jgi:hypothetical protein